MLYNLYSDIAQLRDAVTRSAEQSSERCVGRSGGGGKLAENRRKIRGGCERKVRQCDLHRSHAHNDITCPSVRRWANSVFQGRACVRRRALCRYLGRSFAHVCKRARVHAQHRPRVLFTIRGIMELLSENNERLV